MSSKRIDAGPLGPPLRAQAEAEFARAPPVEVPAGSAEELLHELQVHQIELEMQNEALRRAHVDLEESRDRYVDLYEFAPVGYLTLTGTGRITAANLTAAALLGRERKKMLGRYFDALVVAGDRARWDNALIEVTRRSERAELELELKRGNEGRFHARLDCLRMAAGDAPAAVRVTLVDVSARRHAELESASLLRRLESLMRQASDCIMMCDADDRIVAVSDSCQETYGYSRAELLGMKSSDLLAADVRAAAAGLLTRLAEQGALSYSTWHCRKDGSRFPVEVGATMIDDAGKRYVQAIIRDISAAVRERERIERELSASCQRVKELSRHLVEVQEDARRRLSGELHDRTSPNLAAIKLNLDILAALAPEQAAERAERFEDTRALVVDTDASIRDISAELRPVLLDYAGLPAALAGYARQYAKRTGTAVAVDCVQGDVRLTPAVESLLFRIFQEALTNCAKHARAKSIKVELNCVGNPVTLTVADDGIGFDPVLPEAGERARGQGLLNMQEMAEFSGGRFAIASQPGQGTRIEVRV